jgi:hypothetical protein
MVIYFIEANPYRSAAADKPLMTRWYWYSNRERSQPSYSLIAQSICFDWAFLCPLLFCSNGYLFY